MPAAGVQVGQVSGLRPYRVPPPPGPAATQAGLKTLAQIMSTNNAQTQQRIEFWDAGAPAYRWIDLLNARTLAGIPTTAYADREPVPGAARHCKWRFGNSWRG